ncbi:phytase [Paramecium bursaria Chlorella virus NYs1]|uniref:Phytase n=1 Tax=Paramecium bursaria Chlorella virus NYs1 TaxID=83442 RepID=M1I319_9PHYC|nr:phytase [Paramecium bursaria Chlorella virus NYs1]AGE54105.1 phytase [Paramecium bursaria Chlorella virus IL-5-2s1]AGE54933.1 phytase [Paramecium bursaria Chlorella virus MA1D]AGE58622.1 phytase [Paramecium bursaria Chlorella virus NYs1]
MRIFRSRYDGRDFVLMFSRKFDDDVENTECHFHELTNARCFSCCNHIVIRSILLQHQPHCFYVILRISPISFGIYITEIHAFFDTIENIRDHLRDFTSHELMASVGTLVIETNRVAYIHVIRLTVIFTDPISVQLCNTVRASRIKRSIFRLRNFLHFSIQL